MNMNTEKKINMGWNFDNSYVHLPKKLYTKQEPTPVSSPKLIVLNKTLAKSLGLDVPALESDNGVAVLSGNSIPEGALPIAQAYAGHQFGYFTMLGDGRVALGPMLREYIISEALNNLDIPTTRSLAVVTTGENIIRETVLSGAILTRIASSHIRVGTFQYISAYGNVG